MLENSAWVQEGLGGAAGRKDTGAFAAIYILEKFYMPSIYSGASAFLIFKKTKIKL